MTYRSEPYIVLTREGATKIAGANSTSGSLALRHVPSEDLYVVNVVEITKGSRIGIRIPREYTVLNWGDALFAGQWMRATNRDVNIRHFSLLHRPGVGLDFSSFRQIVGDVSDPGENTGLLITHDPGLNSEELDAGVNEFAGWLIQRNWVQPLRIEVEPHVMGVKQLEGAWPIKELASNSIMIVGCGSIGSVAAEALAGYGIGRVELVDPDRFLWHNILRHVLGTESVGSYKVSALKSHLARRWPAQHVGAHRIDVVHETHYVRPLVDTVDLILCAADGIAPRRVVSHLARRAGKPAVLACVLANSAIGEVLRLRPTPRFGCLLCFRRHLTERGAMDAEADQELAYGTGRVHQPMTAVPPDLRYVGTLAAKTAVATLLESVHGDHTQRLPGEHATLGLRPTGDLAAPFDLREAGEIRWASIPPPRTTCPTCAAA